MTAKSKAAAAATGASQGLAATGDTIGSANGGEGAPPPPVLDGAAQGVGEPGEDNPTGAVERRTAADVSPAEAIEHLRDLMKHDADLLATVKAAIMTDPEFLASVRDAMQHDVEFLQFIGEQAARAIAPSTAEDEAAAIAEAKTRAGREKAEKTARAEADRKALEEAERRAAAQASAKALHDTLMAGEAHAVIDYSAIEGGALLLSDGETFCVDYALPVERVDLALTDQGNVVLRHAPLAIGVGIDVPFTVTAVVLRLKVGDDDMALSCAMSQPFVVGGGQNAKIGENSLVFRRRHVATGAAADAEAAAA